MFTRILAAFIALVLPAAAEDPWRYIEPTSKVLVGIQWRRLFESPLGATFKPRLQEALAMPALRGMGPLSDVDMVLFSSRGTPSEGQKNVPTLIAIAGRFDLNVIRNAVAKRSKRMQVQSVEIYSGVDRAGSPLSIGLVSPDLLLMGDPGMIVRALGTQAGASSLLLTRARQMNEENAFWVVTSIAPSEDAVAANLPFPFPIHEVKALEMGFSITEGVGMQATVRMISEESASKFKGELNKALHLVSKEKNVPVDLKGIEKHLAIDVDGEFVRMSFQLEAPDLDRRLRSYAARARAVTKEALAAAPEPPPANAKPVIWNLDPQPR